MFQLNRMKFRPSTKRQNYPKKATKTKLAVISWLKTFQHIHVCHISLYYLQFCSKTTQGHESHDKTDNLTLFRHTPFYI